MEWIYDDGGRAAAGFTGDTGDCVTRSIAIITGLSYKEVYEALHQRALSTRSHMAKLELRYGGRARTHASPRTGVPRKLYDPYLDSLGYAWVPTMQIGSGCKVHLREGELPPGRLIVRVTKHVTAVIDGVIHDTHDPSRDGSRCVYGYFHKP